MYIPKSFIQKDENQTLSFMKKFSFATIVSVSNETPIATHLPFVIEKENDDIILTSHWARANEQWRNIESQKVLTIFTEPHAYISPQAYDKHESVPTWNYISVHAYGQVEIIDEPDEVLKVLEQMIMSFDPTYEDQWRNISMDYKKGMVNGIVAFRIRVTELQANEKLSQNKKEHERVKIVESLAESKHESERQIAGYMKANTKEK